MAMEERAFGLRLDDEEASRETSRESGRKMEEEAAEEVASEESKSAPVRLVEGEAQILMVWSRPQEMRRRLVAVLSLKDGPFQREVSKGAIERQGH
jgi:hypothetical protein